jgi:hypothetical protein
MIRIRSPLEIPKRDPRVKFEEKERIEDERLSDLINLGIPSEDQTKITWQGEYFDPTLVGYTLELFGPDAEEFEPETREILFRVGVVNPHHVIYRIHDSNFITEAAFYVYVIRVREASGQIVREYIWHPDIRDWLSMKRNVWVVHVEKAKTLISYVEKNAPLPDTETQLVMSNEKRVGRPVRFKNKEIFLAALGKAAEQLKSEDQPITQPNIAGLIEADERDIRRWCTKFTVDWETWKQGYC